jgi:uncharacterized membrane protein YeaQ/YmgE (transglycosylase-associated protein family)
MNLAMLALWVAVGLAAGSLAGFIMKQGGYRRKEDILLGLVGSLVGGIVWALGISPEAAMVTVVSVVFVGAIILIVLQLKTWPAIGSVL